MVASTYVRLFKKTQKIKATSSLFLKRGDHSARRDPLNITIKHEKMTKQEQSNTKAATKSHKGQIKRIRNSYKFRSDLNYEEIVVNNVPKRQF